MPRVARKGIAQFLPNRYCLSGIGKLGYTRNFVDLTANPVFCQLRPRRPCHNSSYCCRETVVCGEIHADAAVSRAWILRRMRLDWRCSTSRMRARWANDSFDVDIQDGAPGFLFQAIRPVIWNLFSRSATNCTSRSSSCSSVLTLSANEFKAVEFDRSVATSSGACFRMAA